MSGRSILPWPYTLEAGEEVRQSVAVKLVGKTRKSSRKPQLADTKSE